MSAADPPADSLGTAPAGPPPLADTVAERTAIARQSLRGEAKKLQRLLGKLEVDRQRAEGAPQLRLQADAIKLNLKTLPRSGGPWQLVLPWEPSVVIEVSVPPASTPLQEMERLYRRARGMELGQRIIAERADQTQLRLWRVEELQQAYAELHGRVTHWQQAKLQGETPPERAKHWLQQVDTWLHQLRALGLAIGGEHRPSEEQRRIAKKKGAELPKGVELHYAPSGAPVLVGRNAAANDALVTRYLRGRDWWFHVRDQTGAHVVLRCEGSAAPAEEDLRACAVLAAHLSGVAKGARLEVTLAQGKGVRKVKGAAAGSVYVSGERAMRVEVEAAVVDGFYARRSVKA